MTVGQDDMLQFIVCSIVYISVRVIIQFVTLNLNFVIKYAFSIWQVGIAKIDLSFECLRLRLSSIKF